MIKGPLCSFDLSVVLVVALGCGTCATNHVATGCERVETYRACVEQHAPDQCERLTERSP